MTRNYRPGPAPMLVDVRGEVMTTNEAVVRLGVSKSTIFHALKDGRMDHLGIGTGMYPRTAAHGCIETRVGDRVWISRNAAAGDLRVRPQELAKRIAANDTRWLNAKLAALDAREKDMIERLLK